MNDLVIRPAGENDIPGILETLKAALGETPLLRRTPELWSWKHVLNPFGQSIVLVAESRDRIAGVRAMMRWRLKTPHGESLSCLRPVDTATHPDFVRQGIFRELTMTALDVARSEGVQLVFNTPNDKSAPGYLKMGWSDVGRIGVLVRPRLGASIRPEPSEVPSIGEYAPGILPFSDASRTMVDRPPLSLRTPRHPEYLTWRFGRHPTADYGCVPEGERAGLVARAGVRSGRPEIVVSDLIGSPSPSVIQALARHSKTRYLAGWFSPGTPERTTAFRAGMWPIPGLQTLRLVALPLVDVDFDVFDPGSWDLATSDLELL